MRRSYVIAKRDLFYTGNPGRWSPDLHDAARWRTLRAASDVLSIMPERAWIEVWVPSVPKRKRRSTHPTPEKKT